MINISDKLTAKTMDGIVADSHQIQYEQGKTTQRGDTVADKITELEGKIGTVQTDLDGYVKYQQQTKTEGEKQTARDNIGAASMETVQALKDKDTAIDGEIASIKTSTESMEKAVANSLFELKTNTYTKTEINTKLTDASVTKVSTTAGTFDENGMTIEKTNAKTKGNFNEKGVTVIDATGSTNTELLFAGYDEELNETIVRTKNINVTKYLTLGANSRMEDYVDEDNEDCTGVFWIGD